MWTREPKYENAKCLLCTAWTLWNSVSILTWWIVECCTIWELPEETWLLLSLDQMGHTTMIDKHLKQLHVLHERSNLLLCIHYFGKHFMDKGSCKICFEMSVCYWCRNYFILLKNVSKENFVFTCFITAVSCGVLNLDVSWVFSPWMT